jgi:hypothetical protein
MAMGIASMAIPTFFWFAAISLYVGVLLGLLDVAFAETEVPVIVRAILGVVLLGFGLGFTFEIVLYPSKVDVQANWFKSNYKEGADINGISWKPEMSELRVTVSNNGERSIDHVNFEIYTPESYEEVKQSTSLSCNPVEKLPVVSIHDSAGNVWHRGNQHFIRFTCDSIPAKAPLEFVIATVNEELFNNILKGQLSSASVYGPKRKPKIVEVHMYYNINFRPYKYLKTIDVGGDNE